MDFSIYDKENILILGAGSSVEYGLPVWTELSCLIEEELKIADEKYTYKKEIKTWLEKIGEGKNILH